ncbi:MAG: Y-family DNA polymerase [Prolixibacteraceae bacterium]|mgnify:CR=1 FL=1|jgi:DNA polymerase V|nr:Y-family DNA polymerase [Prolixibacteraceae bacterium]MBT6764296.1 Y-family DNA polymerase [Prolixibacteraceae bacterium]MBT7000931.1 Y-family DNA polymerase [Prolixibacteraceae bacterium]MBT7397324.1 Y-family DNA polymerase [Prolixibacteraceae bacterium]
MFALVDCNNFYVSCERVFNPKLKGKPVIVLSNNDGCIIARSEEAKLLGLKMAEPVFKKLSFLKKNGVRVFSSNYTLYGDMSQRVTETLSHFFPQVEIYSIDEAFLNLSDMNVDLEELSKNILTTVKQNTGIPVSIGIGPTKTLAKIANKAAKLTGGIFIIKNDRQRDTIIRNTPIEKVWGIGRQYSKLLIRNGVKTAFDFAELDNNWLKTKMKVIGVRIKKELLGEPCIPLELIIPAKKAIATTRAFGKKTSELKYIEEAVSTYAVRCAEKLRKQKTVANLLTIFIHTDPFNRNEPQINKSKTITLPVATNDSTELVKYALVCLNNLFETKYKYKKAGVIVDGLQSETSFQGNIFDKKDRKQQKLLLQTIDKMNAEFGRDKVKLAIQGSGKEWKLKQEKLSKRYTTNWEDIIEVKA